jgi:undecaprenyl diphosphate synthase
MNKISIPKHVAFIMDGNRRWAKEHHLPVFEGHRKGEKRIEPIIDSAIEMGISHLTFWAFSTENWYRSNKEVHYLLNLFRHVLDKKIDSFHRKNIKLSIIGDITKFPADIREKTKKWMDRMKDNKKITVNIALSYGGRDEIMRAVNKWRGNLELTEEEYEKYLDTAGQPDPDLIIRTGGEKRLSGFLLWQSEYAELYFTDIYWPDFTPEEFKKAVEDYSNRKRRFGR